MSDPFKNLPSAPSPLGVQKGHPVAPVPLGVADIKDFISPKLYGELSWDENRTADAVCEDCIRRAEELTSVLLHLVGEDFSLYSKTQREVVKTLTVYELYLYNGDRYKAKGFFEKAERLISDRYSSLAKKREDVSPVAAVRVP